MSDPTCDVPVCKHCGTDLPEQTGGGTRRIYCSLRCRRGRTPLSEVVPIIPVRTSGDSLTKTCTHPGCDRPLRARDLCAMHWRQQYGKRTKVLVPCVICATEVEKRAGDNRRCTCSTMCRAYLQHGSWPASTLPAMHPARGRWPFARHSRSALLIPSDHPVRWPYLDATCPVYYGDCVACGNAFVDSAPIRRVYCTPRCSALIRKRDRDGEHFTWAELMGLFAAFDRCCAYCSVTIREPSPDHVIPVSRGGSNSITNILPACRSCNSAKCDRTPAEWAVHRHVRGVEPRVTSWADGDPRYAHLVLIEPSRSR